MNFETHVKTLILTNTPQIFGARLQVQMPTSKSAGDTQILFKCEPAAIAEVPPQFHASEVGTQRTNYSSNDRPP